MSQRIFSDEELRVASLRSVDAVHEALDAGDRDGAGRYARRLRREAISMRANYDGWEAKLLAWIETRTGRAAAEEAAAAIDPAGGPLPSVPEAETLDFGSRWRELADAIGEALRAGDDQRARAGATALHEEALRYHDRGMRRVEALLSWIGRRYDTDALEAAYVEAMDGDLLGQAGFRERAEALMHFTRVHLQAFGLEEDDQKLTFLCPVCPSGGRLLREGAGDAHVIAGPRWLTWERDELPVYCAHEPIMERASIQRDGVPLFLVDPSDDLGQTPCKTYLYKDPADIPERFYTRLGLTRPRR